MVQFPHKVYLNGADCFHLMLERNITKHTIGNNIIRMVMTINDHDTLKRIITNIEKSPIVHWIANIELKQPFFLNPYWSYKNQGKKVPIIELAGEFDTIPSEILEDNFSLKNGQLIRFHLYKTKDKKIKFVFSFHHILIDGRGSGLLIKHLTTDFDEENFSFQHVFPKPIKKINFIRHTVNMFQVKKFVENTMRKPIGHPAHTKLNDHEFLLRIKNFTPDETNIIDANAKKNGARFGTNLFQIACCAHAIQPLTQDNSDLWLPVPYDGRKRGSKGPIISNNISFLFYRLSFQGNPTLEETVNDISSQMNEQLKLEMPRKYNEMLQFMKFIPKRFYHWMTTKAGKGAISSFLYSSSGEAVWDTSNFSTEISDTLLIPPFTYPPGISITFLRYEGKLRMNIAVSSNKIDNNKLSLLENKLVELLLLGQ